MHTTTHRRSTINLLHAAAAAALFFVLVGTAHASPVLRSGESVSIEADQVVEGDLYAAGNAVNVSGSVEGDAYIAGGTVTINGPVTTDVVVAGGTVQLHGEIGDDLRVIGGEVTVAGAVQGDVVVLGGAVRVLSTATIAGDILFAGGELAVDGPVDGSLFGFAERLRVDSTIGGDVEINAVGDLTLGDRAEVLGNVTYRGQGSIVRAQNAVVVGDIQSEPQPAESPSYEVAAASLAMLLFAGLVALLVFKPVLNTLVTETEKSYGVFGLVGLGVLVGTPLVALLLMFSILGFLVGVLLLVGYLALLVAAWIVAGPILGAIILRRFKENASLSILAVVLGVLVVELVSIIPYIGLILVFALFIIVLGALSSGLYRLVR